MNVALEIVAFGAVLQALVATRAAINKSLNMLIGCQQQCYDVGQGRELQKTHGCRLFLQ